MSCQIFAAGWRPNRSGSRNLAQWRVAHVLQALSTDLQGELTQRHFCKALRSLVQVLHSVLLSGVATTVSGTFFAVYCRKKTVQSTVVIIPRGAHLAFMNALYISFKICLCMDIDLIQC